MTIQNRKQLKQTADRRLAGASYLPRKLILIHSGVLLAMSLLMAICNYVITWQIDANGGGLNGIQLRSILETAYQALNVIYNILVPFWSLGLVYVSIRLARGKSAWPGSLLEGFRCWKPALRLMLLQTLIYSIITFASIYGAWFIYSMTPAGTAFMEAIVKLVSSGITDYVQLMEQIPAEVIERVAKGYLPILGVILLGLILPAMYRMRLAQYIVMDKPATGAWRAVRNSGKIMRRNCFRLFMLDLSYWWYYLIPVILLLPAYADGILEYFQIQLPVDGAVLYIVGNLLYAILTLIFEYVTKPKVITTYGLAYDALLEQYEAMQPVKPAESEA